MSYLTEEEIDALQNTDLHRETPFLIRGVSQTQFSIARYYGGVKYNGHAYTYLADTDELIRDDVEKWVTKRRKPKRTAKKVSHRPAGLSSAE